MWELEEGRGVRRDSLNEVLRHPVSGEELWDAAERKSDGGESLI